MANTQTVVSISTTEDLGTMDTSSRPFHTLTKLINFLAGVANGSKFGTVDVQTSSGTTPAGSSATLTFSSVGAGEVIAVNGVCFLAVNGSASTSRNEFDMSGSDTADAASFVTAVNASSLSNTVKASSSGAVVTLTSQGVGTVQNGIDVETLGVVATATLTPSGVAATDTFVINGTTFTAEQEMARATAQATAVIAGDVITINSIPFTCVASGATGNQFNYSSSMTTLTTNLKTAVNACTDPNISGKVTAASSTDTLKLRAIASGTGGNSYTLTQSGSTWSLSGATFSGGAATSNNKFDYGDTDAQTIAEVVRAIGASTSTNVTDSVRLTSTSTLVNVYSKFPGLRGNCVTLSGTGGFTASAARLAGGAIAQHEGVQASGTVTLSSGNGTITATINGVDVAITWASSDTNSAALLAAAINSSTNALVRGVVTATSSAGVTTVTAVRGGISGNNITLAVTGTGATASAARLASGAAPTHAALGGSAAKANSFPGARLGGGSGLPACGGANANSITV